MSIDESLVMDFGSEQSPFLPNTFIQFAWDSTSLGLIKTCPRLYQYTMIEGFTGKDENIHLRFGIEYHKALQDYDDYRTADADHQTALHLTVKDVFSRVHDWEPDLESKAGKYKNPNSLLRSVVGYLDKYQDDPAKTFVLSNGRAATELSFRFELDYGPDMGADSEGTSLYKPYILSGHLDRVVTFADSLFIMDRKTTTSALGDYYFNQFEPNNQMSLYTMASQVVLGSPVKGIMIDAAQLLINGTRFGRQITYRTPDQTQEWLTDLKYTLTKAEDYAAEGYWPMNDTACDKFGGCRFRAICSKSPKIRDSFLKTDFFKGERWNPLKAR